MPKRIRESSVPTLPRNEQPRYRMDQQGTIALADSELLSIITRVRDTTILQRAIAQAGGVRRLFQRLQQHDVIPELTALQADQLRAAFELGRRLLLVDRDERVQIRSPRDAADLLMLEMSHLDQEHLRTVLLDTKNRVQTISTVYIGSVNTSMVRVGEVFKEAIRRNSVAIIVAHNHPSGDPTPSPEDTLVTTNIVKVGTLLDIAVLDHLIIGQGRYVSMRERGLGF